MSPPRRCRRRPLRPRAIPSSSSSVLGGGAHDDSLVNLGDHVIGHDELDLVGRVDHVTVSLRHVLGQFGQQLQLVVREALDNKRREDSL